MSLATGAVLQGRYRIQRQLGGGGMGEVYFAEDTRLPGRYCAIKEMSPEQLAPQDRNWAIQAFKQEAQLLATLRHPGLAAVTDFFPEGGNWYLVMEFVEGESLEERLSRASKGRLSAQEALHITRQLCDVLEYLHSLNPPIIFRDLKPSNVMVLPNGQIKLIDFGIARFFKQGQTRDTLNMGTPGYAAPEQYGGMGQTDPRTDVYSLGVVLYRMVTGYDPAAAVTPFSLPPTENLAPDVPSNVAQAISRSKQLQPELRYNSVREMRQALFTPTTLLPPDRRARKSQPSPAAPGRGIGKGMWIGVGLAGVALIACAILALLYLTGIFPPRSKAATTEQPPVVVPTTVSVAPSEQPTELSESPTEETAATSTSTPPVGASAEKIPPTATHRAPTPTLTRTPPPVSGPQLVFVSGNVGATDIYVAGADGRDRRCVACQSCDEAEPGWFPGGRAVVYQSDCGGSYDLWQVNADGSNPTQLTRTARQDEREPDVSPDGKSVVFRVNAKDSERNADGDLQVLTLADGRVSSLGEWGRAPVWSPDGQQIAFMSERSGRWQIYVYNMPTRTTRQMTTCSVNCRWPAWSPDGDAVAYHTTTSASSTTADTIWYAQLSAGRVVEVVGGAEAGRPSWSVNGLIVFNSTRGIEVIRANGADRRTLISSDQNWAPEWLE